MTNLLDSLQKAWQSQCSNPIDVRPDQLLKTARLGRRLYFWVDMLLISFFLWDMLFMLWSAFRSDIHKGWPWLTSTATSGWIVGYVLFNRWRRRRHAAHYDEPLLAHVEWSIKDIEHRMWQDRNSLWWYILPIAFGCMIPPVFFFAMQHGKKSLFDALMPLLVTEVTFAAVFVGVYLTMKYFGRIAARGQQQELQALRALRESLLNPEEPRV